MTGAALVLAATCVLEEVQTRVSQQEGRWVEEVALTMRSRGQCHGLEVPLPAGVDLEPGKVVVRFGDGGRRRAEDRWDRDERGLDGATLAHLVLPELLAGDRATVRFTRASPADRPFRWRPGQDGAAWAELRWEPDLVVSIRGDLGVAPRHAWVNQPGDDVEVRIHTSHPSAPPAAPPAKTTTTGLSALAAWERVRTLAWLPRAVDGPTPLAGDAALSRGAADDRGIAATLAALAAGGPDPVEVGWWLPDDRIADHLEIEAGAVAVGWIDGVATALVHPAAPIRTGTVWTPRGEVPIEAPPTGSAAPIARARPQVTRQLALRIPGNDAQRLLFPGGGSSVDVTEQVTVPASPTARAWTISVPRGSTPPTSAVEGDATSTLSLRDDSLVWVVGPAATQTRLTVAYTRSDAPTCGASEPPPGAASFDLRVGNPDGEVVWERGWWRLDQYLGRPVVPVGDDLLDALDYRFATRSLPEPAIPVGLKNHSGGWELVALLRPLLHERVRTAPLPADPLWPRRLVKARGTGVLTPLEAALTLRLQALQAQIPAAWVLVRPAELGEAPAWCPSAFAEAVVRVWWDDQQRWIDPTCTVCGPWELRPQLEGATALGRGTDRTPPPTPGRLAVEVGPDQITWHAEGPAALLARLWVAEVPSADRSPALAEWVAGAGASLASQEGFGEPGVPFDLVVTRAAADAVFLDPLVLGERGPDTTTWVPWIGTRSLARADGPAGERTVERPAFRYVRTWADGSVTETLEVRERRWSEADALDLADARRPLVAPAPPPEPSDPPPTP